MRLIQLENIVFMNLITFLILVLAALFLVIVLLIFYIVSLKRSVLLKQHEVEMTLKKANELINEAMASREEAMKEKEEINKKIEDARRESVSKSRDVVVGRVSEQLAPFFPGFKYNPKDVRFIGTPIDLIIFDGMDNGNITSIVFLEVKSGASKLTEREKAVMEAINSGRVSFDIYRINTTNSAIDEI